MSLLLFDVFKMFYLCICTSCRSLEGKWSYTRFEVHITALLNVHPF